jgi:hypothetical protein
MRLVDGERERTATRRRRHQRDRRQHQRREPASLDVLRRRLSFDPAKQLNPPNE